MCFEGLQCLLQHLYASFPDLVVFNIYDFILKFILGTALTRTVFPPTLKRNKQKYKWIASIIVFAICTDE